MPRRRSIQSGEGGMRIYHAEVSWNTNDWRTTVPTCNVIEPESFTRFSGLLDASGNKLMVTVQSEPAGFIVFGDRRAS
jgi:hypothetical protein